MKIAKATLTIILSNSKQLMSLKKCSINGFMKRNFGGAMGFTLEILRQASMVTDEQYCS